MLKKFFPPFFIVPFLISALCAQNKTIDSLLELLKNDKPDTNKVIHLNKLCWDYLSIGNYTPALENGNAALQLALQLNFKNGIATSYTDIGLVYYKRSDYEKALENHFASLKIQEELHDKNGIATSYNNIGVIYHDQGNYDKALENHFASLKIREETQDKNGIAASFNNIGLIYYDEGNYEKALENYLASLKMREETGDKQAIGTLYNNIGLIYSNRGKIEEALENYLASLKICENIGDKQGIAASYNNIGDVYRSKNKPDKALENYFASLKICEEIGDKEGIAMGNIAIANVYSDKLNYGKASEWLEKGLQFAKETGAKQLLLEVYKGLSEVSEKTNDYRNAYKYHQLYSGFKDSIFNEKNAQQIAELQTKYETEKKEKENKLLIQQNLLQQAKIEKRTLMLIILISILIFTIAISLLLYYRYKLKQQTLMEQEMNSQQQLRFKAIIDAEEKERRRIAQELHDGLGQLLSTAKLNISVLEDSPPDEKQVKNALALIDNAIDEVRTISHNMMPGVLIRLGLISALRELVRKISDSNKIKVELTADCDERLSELSEIAIYRIVQESVNNMIKYSQGSGIMININKNRSDLFLEINDNGIGFDTSLIENSSGIGWKNIYARTSLLQGIIQVTSAPSKGTSVNIHFPNLFSEQQQSLSLKNGKRN